MHAVKDNLGKRTARKRKTSAIRGPRRSHLGGSRLQLKGAWALNLWPCPTGGREEGPSWVAARGRGATSQRKGLFALARRGYPGLGQRLSPLGHASSTPLC